MELLLASQSPRRREMMSWLHLPFTPVPASVDETPQTGEEPTDLVLRLAQAKTRAIAAPASAWVLAGDTMVVLDGMILGKPRDAQEAQAMLQALRGREHQVLSALTLRHGDHLSTRLVTTRVWMRAYTQAEIEAYIASGDPFDKAGAYAIQHPVFQPVDHMQVCYAAVVGFPLCALQALFRAHGLALPITDMPALCQEHFGYTCPQRDEGRLL